MAHGSVLEWQAFQQYPFAPVSGNGCLQPESYHVDGEIEGAFAPLDTAAIVAVAVNAFANATGQPHEPERARVAAVRKVENLESEVLAAEARSREALAEVRHMEVQEAEICEAALSTGHRAEVSEQSGGALCSAAPSSAASTDLAGEAQGLMTHSELVESEATDVRWLNQCNDRLRSEGHGMKAPEVRSEQVEQMVPKGRTAGTPCSPADTDTTDPPEGEQTKAAVCILQCKLDAARHESKKLRSKLATALSDPHCRGVEHLRSNPRRLPPPTRSASTSPRAPPPLPPTLQQRSALMRARDDCAVTSLRQELEALHFESQDLNSEMRSTLHASEAVQRQNLSLEAELASLHREANSLVGSRAAHASKSEEVTDQASSTLDLESFILKDATQDSDVQVCSLEDKVDVRKSTPRESNLMRSTPFPLSASAACEWLRPRDHFYDQMMSVKQAVDSSLTTMRGLQEHAQDVQLMCEMQHAPRPDILKVAERYTRDLQRANQEWSQVKAHHSKAWPESAPLSDIMQERSRRGISTLLSEAAHAQMSAQNLASRLQALQVGVSV